MQDGANKTNQEEIWMKRKRWFIGSLMAAVVVLGITGGAVMAQEATGPDGDSPIMGLAARVAEILGIDEVRVQEAIVQAKAEMHAERLQARLDAMVSSGRLTQEQADAYKAWIEARPEGLSPRSFGRFGGRGGFGRHGFHGGWSFKWAPAAPAPDGLETTL